MAQSHVLSALIDKRATLLGQINALEEQIAKIHDQLAHVDGCMRIFGYEGAPETSALPRRPRVGQLFEKGELSRFLLDQIRQHPDGITIEALAAGMRERKGWSPDDPRYGATITKRVRKSLGKLKERGVVVSEWKPGQRVTWRLVG
ncbi:MAG: hypothetical protein CMM50_00555 [Rhodospirillaceae bacterium]|nr:hypothetical protein [Rhodospirillaceae bacterium]